MNDRSNEIIVETYAPFPEQQLFHSSPAKYRLFGGAAGPGKTTAILWEGIMQALETPGVDTLLMRRTYPELESSLLKEFRRSVPWRQLGGHFQETKHMVTWPNGSVTRFGYCDNERDVYRHQGAEYKFIGIDELTHFTLGMWQFLSTRNRCPVPGVKASMAGATNPGNIGHAWVKALWIDKKPAEGMDDPRRYDPADYDFIPARLENNPIYANDASYRKTLESLPGPLRAAMLEGSWDNFAGQYFSNWDEAIHVWAPAEIQFQRYWPRWISLDWGFQHHTAVYWHTQAGVLEEDGKTRPLVVTYKEYVRSNLSERALAEEIVAVNDGDKIQSIYAGHDLWKEDGPGKTKEAAMSEVFRGAGLPSIMQAKTDRVNGWRLMHLMLDEGRWIVTKNCKHAIEAIPTAIFDEKKQNEDILKTNDVQDDVRDSLRYGLYSQYGPADIPFEQKLMQKVAHLADPTSRNLQLTKLNAEHERDLRTRGQVNSRSSAKSGRFSR